MALRRSLFTRSPWALPVVGLALIPFAIFGRAVWPGKVLSPREHRAARASVERACSWPPSGQRAPQRRARQPRPALGLAAGRGLDRHTFRPYGLYGGAPGKPSRNRLISDGRERELTAKVTMTPMRRGDVFVHDQPGPGGWGDPLERDPARVVRDVLNELVSLESARDDYGVVIDASTLAVDEAALGLRGLGATNLAAAGAQDHLMPLAHHPGDD